MSMKTVVIGSTNPVKVAAVARAFGAAFPHDTFSFVSEAAASGVAAQPFGEAETKQGAQNRAWACRAAHPAAAFTVGLEGGLLKKDDGYWVTAFMCVISDTDVESFGQTGAFRLPTAVARHIDEGMELGHACDAVFETTNSKHAGGAVGLLTNDLITRADFYDQALIFALIPFMRPDLYPDVD